MSPYRPFLLPLLEQQSEERTDCPSAPPAKTSAVQSPLEEEQLIARMAGDPALRWTELQKALPGAYGLSLIIEWNGAFTRPPQAGIEDSATLSRFLRLEDPEGPWFLIEHPSALHLFDQFAADLDRVAVGRPSLFNRLWRESEAPASSSVRIEEAKAVGFGGDRLALQRHVERILRNGNPSDWHLEPIRSGFRSRLRIHGRLAYPEFIPREKGIWLQNSLRTQAGVDESLSRQAQEGRLLFSGCSHPVTLRLSFVPVLYGQAMVARFQYPEGPHNRGMESLGLEPEQVRRILSLYRAQEGLWLFVGPTGSGKTTSLHALVQESVRHEEKILTVEDPVEQIVEGAQQISLDPERGLTYARVIRAFLRQAPDTILLGEIRDPETANTAIQAARTGHRILSTLHARDDTGVLRRLQDLGQNPRSVQPLLKLVLHQRLLPRLCSRCRTSQPLPAELQESLLQSGLNPTRAIAGPVGCPLCHSGYDGRVALFSSGRFLDNPDVSGQLGNAAWRGILEGSLSLRDCLPLLPDIAARSFELCHW